MQDFEKNPEFERDVRSSFGRQKLMKLYGATLTHVESGAVEIQMPFNEELTQQHGYLHAAVVTALVDSACGYAALTICPADVEILTVEYKAILIICRTHFVQRPKYRLCTKSIHD